MLEFIDLTNSFNVQRTIQITSVEGGSIHVSRIKLGVNIWYLNEVNHDQISSINAKKKFIILNPTFARLLQLALDATVVVVRSCCHCVLYC